MKDKKKILLIILMLTIVFSVIGGTFAYLNWQSATSQRTNVTFTATANFSCSADGGGNITSNDVMLAPASCTNSTYAIKRKVTLDVKSSSSEPISLSFWLNVNEIGDGLSNSDNFRYAITFDENSCSKDVIAKGTFKNKKVGDKVILLDNSEVTGNISGEAYLYIWLDSAETSTSTMNQTFNLSLGGECANNIEKNYMISLGSAAKSIDEDTRNQLLLNITYMAFVNYIDTSDAVFSGDISENQDKSIMFWLEPNDESKYDIYIGSERKIYAKDLSYLTAYMPNLKSISFDNLNTSETTNMRAMFGCDLFAALAANASCDNLSSLDLSNFDTSNVTNMSYMFADRVMDVLDLSSFNTSNVINMNGMFGANDGLTNIYVSELWNTDNVTDSEGMFSGSDNLPNFNAEITDITNAHYGEGGYLTYKAYAGNN